MLSRDLNWIPNSSAKKRHMLDGLTGRLLHEIGHAVAAAKQGYPTDLIILDESLGPSLDCAYIHDSLRSSLEINKAAQNAILAGGFMAEYTLFSEVAVHRAISDIEALCRQQSINFNKQDDTALISAARYFLEQHMDLFDHDDTRIIKKIYTNAAKIIITGKAWQSNAFIIPRSIWSGLIRIHNHTAEAAAIHRATQANYSLDVLESLRGHNGRSGV